MKHVSINQADCLTCCRESANPSSTFCTLRPISAVASSPCHLRRQLWAVQHSLYGISVAGAAGVCEGQHTAVIIVGAMQGRQQLLHC
jgi:hypothetical protein